MGAVFLGSHVDPRDADELRRLARESERSVAAELRLAIRSWIEDAPRRAASELLDRMSREELDEYLTGIDDGRDEAQDDGRRGATRRRHHLAVGAAKHGSAT